MREMFADERCTGAVLDFLRTTEVGARVTGEAAGAATRTNRGEGGGRYTVSLGALYCPFFLSPLFLSLSLFLFFSHSFFPFFSLSFRRTDRAGAGGVAASRWRTARGRSGRRTLIYNRSLSERPARGKRWGFDRTFSAPV